MVRRKITGVGAWTDDEGNVRNAVLALDTGGDAATVSVGGLHQPLTEMAAPDRKTAYFLNQLQDEIRAIEHSERPITSYWKSSGRGRQARQ